MGGATQTNIVRAEGGEKVITKIITEGIRKWENSGVDKKSNLNDNLYSRNQAVDYNEVTGKGEFKSNLVGIIMDDVGKEIIVSHPKCRRLGQEDNSPDTE